MRVLALNFGDANCASSYYRILQYVEALGRRGIHLQSVPANDFADWNAVRNYDLVIVQKKLFSLGKVRRLRRDARRLLYDVDDAVWEPQGPPHHWLTRCRTRLRLRSVARAARVCLAANQVLAAAMRTWSPNVEILPMALDESLWPPRDPLPGAGPSLRIGWAGAPVNHVYLEAIEPALADVQERHPQIRFVVFSGRPPRFRRLRHEFLPFQRGAESEIIRSFDIGLLPLPRDRFAEGKSPIKALQYMASGVPTVASSRSATRELFADGGGALFVEDESDWPKALEALIRDPASRIEMGRRGRSRFEQVHSLAMAAPRFARLLRTAATDSRETP